MKIVKWVVGILVCTAMLVPPDQKALARPQYSKSFKTTYAKELADNTEGTSCTVCHLPEKKTLRNNYGDAIKETMKGKNVKNSEAIEAALREAEKMPSAVEGKTFGDLIKEGRLPASR
jgi:hypothetical protein